MRSFRLSVKLDLFYVDTILNFEKSLLSILCLHILCDNTSGVRSVFIKIIDIQKFRHLNTFKNIDTRGQFEIKNALRSSS